MGTYFNPPQLLPEVARKLNPGSYSELVAQLQPGEELFGHYDRFMFQNAVHLYSGSEFDEFENQVRSTMIARLGFYAMPEEEFKKI
jgi:hypothetical protein